MTAITWDGSGTHKYESGVDHGVLYPLNSSTHLYDTGVPWNGLTTITETPSGASPNAQYADNIKFLNLLSTEIYGFDIEAFTFPTAFEACDGTAAPVAGVAVGQQNRQTFGMSYRTQLGDDTNSAAGYKLHLVYGCLASPSQKAYSTINDSPAALSFKWTVSCTPVAVTNYKPTSLITIDSTVVDPSDLSSLEAVLYGTSGAPSLPLPNALIAMFS